MYYINVCYHKHATQVAKSPTSEIGFQYNLNELWGHPATATDIASGDVPANAHSLSFESGQGEFVRENLEAGKVHTVRGGDGNSMPCRSL
jgi:hypothetical protein